MNYYERHIGDYLKDTAHLSLLEHGVYTRLLDVYYTRESGIPDDQAARLIGARSKDEREALQAVLAEYFVLADGAHTQARSDREIARFQDKQRKAKAAADARWSESGRNANAFPNADAPAMRTHSEGNATRARPQSPDTKPNSEAELPQAPRRGSRLAADWDPGETGLAFASQLGLQPGHVSAELAKFRDHWAAKAGKDGAKLDWQATWRNWLRSVVDRMPRASSAPPTQSFRERDEQAAAQRVAEATGGILGRRQPRQQPLDEVFDVTPRRLG